MVAIAYELRKDIKDEHCNNPPGFMSFAWQIAGSSLSLMDGRQLHVSEDAAQIFWAYRHSSDVFYELARRLSLLNGEHKMARLTRELVGGLSERLSLRLSCCLVAFHIWQHIPNSSAFIDPVLYMAETYMCRQNHLHIVFHALCWSDLTLLFSIYAHLVWTLFIFHKAIITIAMEISTDDGHENSSKPSRLIAPPPPTPGALRISALNHVKRYRQLFSYRSQYASIQGLS